MSQDYHRQIKKIIHYKQYTIQGRINIHSFSFHLLFLDLYYNLSTLLNDVYEIEKKSLRFILRSLSIHEMFHIKDYKVDHHWE